MSKKLPRYKKIISNYSANWLIGQNAIDYIGQLQPRKKKFCQCQMLPWTGSSSQCVLSLFSSRYQSSFRKGVHASFVSLLLYIFFFYSTFLFYFCSDDHQDDYHYTALPKMILPERYSKGICDCIHFKNHVRELCLIDLYVCVFFQEIRPPTRGKTPVLVDLNIFVVDINSINVEDMDFR